MAFNTYQEAVDYYLNQTDLFNSTFAGYVTTINNLILQYQEEFAKLNIIDNNELNSKPFTEVKVTKYLELDTSLLNSSGHSINKVAIRNGFLLEKINESINYEMQLDKYIQKIYSSSVEIENNIITTIDILGKIIQEIWSCIYSSFNYTDIRIKTLYDIISFINNSISDLENKKHYHSNKTELDKISEDTAGNLTYNGQEISSGISDHFLLSNIGVNTHSEIDNHISDSTIHYTQDSISIPASQINDFDTEVSNNVDVIANTTARHEHDNKSALDQVEGVNTGDQESSDFDHSSLSNTHNLTTDIDHDLIANTHGALPTALSELSDDATHRLVTDTEKSTWNNKQEELVSSTNIKTINSESLLGSSDIVLSKKTKQLENINVLITDFVVSSTVTGYEAEIVNAAILATHRVDVTPSLSSDEVAQAASFYNRTISSNGVVMIYCKNIPTEDLTVTLDLIEII